MNRADLQPLAALHLKHAEVLLNAQLFAGAYYISGYAVECALKAAVAKLFRFTADFDLPPQEKPGQGKGGGLNLYSHDLAFLVRVAGLSLDWSAAMESDQDLSENWNVVKSWTPETRYQLARSREEAQQYYSAIADSDHGVFQCIEKFW